MPGTTSGRFSRIVDIIDSTAWQALNGCRGVMVNMLEPSNDPLPTTFYPTGNFTRVHIAVGDTVDFALSTDTTRLKILGGPAEGFPDYNLYVDPAGKVPLNVSNTMGAFPDVAVYAAGLGEVSGRRVATEGGAETIIRLEGYVRNRIEHGWVDPDDVFVGIAFRPRRPEERRSSVPFRFAADGRLMLSVERAGMRDLTGRRAPTEATRFNP
jgi:hypothetical protein